MGIDIAQKVPLHYPDIQPEFDNAMISVSNKLEREWPKELGSEDSAAIVVGLFRVAFTSFKAIRYLAAVAPLDPLRLPEFVIATPPVLRSVLDAYANVVYLFEDLGPRSEAFVRRGWKEEFDREVRYRERYALDPWWATRIAEMASEVTRLQQLLHISADEARTLRRWPALGTMISKDPNHPDRANDSARLSLLTFLNDWFYRELSEETHLTPPGLYRRAELLLIETRLWSEEQRAKSDQLRSDAYMIGFALLLGMASELQNELKFGMAERLTRLWFRLRQHSKMIEEVHAFRYHNLLVGQT